MKAIYLLSILLFSLFSYGQQENRYTVVFTDLTKPAWHKMIIPLSSVILDHIDYLKNIPAVADAVRIHKFSLFESIQKYQDYLSGNLSREAFEAYVVKNKIDTAAYSKYKGIKNGFHVYVGINHALQKKYVIVDENNNHDFSDDSLYSFDLKGYEAADSIKDRTIIYATPSLEIYAKDQISPTTARIEFHPLGKSIGGDKTEMDRYLNMIAFSSNALEGSTIINGVKVNLLAYSRTLAILPIGVHAYAYMFFLQEEGDPEKPRSNVLLKDTIEIADRFVRLSETKGDTLYIDDLGPRIDSSRIGKFLPELFSMSLDDGNSMVQLNNLFRNKYVFIDFWGSWCAPCVASLPKIREFYETVRHRDDVEVIGIALDHERDLEKLKGIIAQKEVEWPNYWNKRKDIKQAVFPHAKLKINPFPTYMIVDKAGKIIYRTQNTKEAIDFFKKVIQEK